MGLLLAVLVTAASVDDAKGAQELFPRPEGQPVGKVVRMFADSTSSRRSPHSSTATWAR